MARRVRPIPTGYHSVTPYLVVANAAGAIEFYKQVFGAVEIIRFPMGDRIGHAELQIGTSKIMLADEHPEMGYTAPTPGGNCPVSIHLYVKDVDSVVERAFAAGATIERPVTDQFYGDRMGTLKDPYGHRWSVATHKEDVSPEEMQRRAAEAHA